MKNLRNILVTAFVVVLVLVIHSCTGADEYLKFTEGGEISYTGKIDSLKFFPGRNRVKIEGLIISDPKVNQLRVYWNSKKDSVVIPINRTAGIDVVSKIIENLPENIYNFEVKTFDAKGNSSISQNVTAQTYGARYQASLTNRKIIASTLSIKKSLTIDFATMDLTSGAYTTEVIYTDNSNVEKTVTVPVATSQVVIPNFKEGSKFKHRSLFLPTKTCIDIFYTDYVEVGPIIYQGCNFYAPTQSGTNIVANPTFAGTFAQATGWTREWTNFDPKSTENFCVDNTDDTSGSVYLKGSCYPNGGVLKYTSGVAIIPNHRYQIKAMIKNPTAGDGAFNFVLPNSVWKNVDNDNSGNSQYLVSIPNSTGWVQFSKIITAGAGASGTLQFLFMSCDGFVNSTISNLIYLDNFEIYDLGL
ncbi:DUF4998 domain-containing protein [Flavobacterium undicola]|uniref:DUF4998 domain-containing protein n=1 Tax=Flavobacterium undicola TaxID=1932779 RepID=UPI00137803AB|nr:DUF4998 domain-containing protein [Flavobacterium undicola]MBA0882952.1 DUF4998 domain-containing protein [Flavobacterium undicola]